MRNWGEFISRFSLESFHDPDLVRDYVNFFEFDKFVFNCDEDSIPSKQESLGSHMISVIPNESKPFEIKYDDLARLHYLILKRKVLITLEFGSGYSTVIIAHANSILMSDFYDLIKDEVRVDNPFHVYAIEEDHEDPGLIFCGTEFGVFFSPNYGERWKKLSSGLPTIAVRDIAIQRDMDDIVLGTFGRGFYVMDDYSVKTSTKCS